MKTRFRHLTHFGLIGLLIIFVCLGCANVGQKFDKWQKSVKETLNFSDSESATEDEKKNGDIYFIHTSRYSGETLGIVADWYTGDSKNEKVLAEINPDLDPKKIEAGSEIFIPVKLLKTRKSMPQNFAADDCKNCYQHTVHWSGESLSLIARWYTGSSGNWRKLAKANPRLNPNRIKKGNVIMIPPALLKTKEPLPQKVAAKYTANYFAHTVKQDGEKMEMIAGWYTGNAANWEVIARANPRINPNRLKAGNEIFIPPKLLKTRQPISKLQSAPTAETPKPKPTAAEKKITPVEEEEIKIFGPKQFPKS